ncbi:MAG: TIGR01906 family membrane protein [Burkholderiales bacterium]|nr:TIGR01906 family membrane protein [Anaerolineae bacterium]
MDTAYQTSSNTSTKRSSSALTAILKTFVTLSVPILLTLVSVRLIMSPLFLQLEYTRSGFPEDFYGFTTDDRLRYAPYALDYLLTGADISYLGDLRFDDDTSMYSVPELEHMRDVQTVTRTAFALALVIGLITIAAAYFLWRAQSTRRDLRRAFFNGAVLTLGLIVAIVITAVIGWDTFFTTFHRLFFTGDSWIFDYSDTLIRLFPEQFWFDAALTIGALTVSGAVAILLIARPRKTADAA